jgi:tetratricopeptide (TPR) repeat protein
MKLYLIALATLLSISHLLNAQATGNAFSEKNEHMHALIIGISKYMNINSLEYADDDALAFKDYLMQSMKVKSDSNNITLLLNEAAISPNIYGALENLISQAKENDKVYIYFSGHGDSENSTLFKSGFLLTHETPKQSYYTNSINIEILNNFVSTLSIQNKAEVVFIVDACHSGNVESGITKGATITAKALAKNVAEEVRMLSCQPDEVSLEGKQWGNGRGLFSYHLINGLWGLADLQGVPDGKVTLNELNIYLSTNVPKDANPVSQYPGVYGPMNKHIGNVNDEFIANFEQQQQPLISTHMTASKSKSYHGKFVEDLTAEQQKAYQALEMSFKENRLQLPDSNNAYYFLNQLIAFKTDPNFVNILKRDLIAKLQEAPQMYINVLLDITRRNRTNSFPFEQWAEDLMLSAELLGPDHKMYTSIMSKAYFMKAAKEFYKIKESNNEMLAKKYATAALREINKAIEQDAQVTFYYTLKGAALNELDGFSAAIETFDKAIVINPNYPYAYSNKGVSMLGLERYEEAIPLFDQTIALDPGYTNAYLYKIQALKKLGRIQETYAIMKEMMKQSEKGANF